MSVMLYRLGRFAYRRRWPVVLVWLLALGAVLGAASSTDLKISSAVTIDGTESQVVIDRLRTEFPETSGGQGTIAFTAPAGERLDEGARADALRAAMREISAHEYVVARDAAPQQQAPAPAPQQPRAQGMLAPGVLASPDGTVAMMQIQFTEQVEDLPAGVIDDVVAVATEKADGVGLTALTTESLKPHEPPLGGHEALGILVAGLVLFLTLGSLRAAGLPLVTGALGVALGLGGAFALSSSIELTSATPVLALMIGLAVGIDYSLFIVNRQRHLVLRDGLAADEAAARALGTAGSAVLFAGLIVVIALSGLTLVGVSFLTTTALVAATTVVLAVLIALTLLPALLGFVGERVVGRRARERSTARGAAERHGVAHAFATTVVRRHLVVTIGVIAVLGITAIPLSQMNLGMPTGATANLDTSERQAADAIARGFGEGYNAPLISVVTAPPGETFDARDLPAVTASLTRDDLVADVRPMGISPDGTLALLSVIPVEGPDAPSTTALVHDLRADDGTLSGVPGAKIGVTGLTAVNLDISRTLSDVLPLYLTIIVVLSLAVLLLVFRSVLIPVKATAGFLLTIGATFGVMTAVFQWGWLKDVVGFDTPGPIVSFLPILVTGILYGLAMDYEVFLVSSMREAEVGGLDAVDAVVRGVEQAGRVVVAAATIMVSVFAGFIFSDDSMVRQFGLALAVGILIDAFLVRLTLTPALMAMAGRAAWWAPRWLEQILPDLDIEGHRLDAHLRRTHATESG